MVVVFFIINYYIMNITRAVDWNKAVGNVSGKVDHALEVNMLTEELNEYIEATTNNDIIEQVDGLIDVIFVAIGTLHKI
jgi:hypothetical protein